MTITLFAAAARRSRQSPRNRSRSLHGGLLSLACLICVSNASYGQDPLDAQTDKPRSAQAWIDSFVNDWDEGRWEKEFRNINGLIRKQGDTQWRTRMLALQGVVRQGKAAIPTLLSELKHSDSHRRIFAAQALRFLAPHASKEALLEAARDPNTTVRLYAVDALGMRGGDDVDFAELQELESDKDVRSHINYAIARRGEPVADATVKQLVDWDASRIDTAAVGKAAPDFSLTAATGETLRLSDFQGKSAVVLVFVYGDT